VGSLDLVDRSLPVALDEIVARVPGTAWRVTPTRLLVTKADLPDPPVTAIHGVADLLAEDASLDPTIRLTGPDGR
jgi:hypothetical protein